MYFLDEEKGEKRTLEFKDMADAAAFAEANTPNCRAGLYFNSVTFFDSKTCDIYFFLYRDDYKPRIPKKTGG